MNKSERLFLWVLIINAVLALLYCLWGILFHKKNELGENTRISYILRSLCMLICPVVGILFFAVGMLIKIIFFRKTVDLDDVIFSKERVKQIVKPDEDLEMNIVPIQDALAVSDKTNLRRLMLNVLKGDIGESLAAISLGLASEDSETSHYAAAALSQELNTFRVNVKRLQSAITKDMEENGHDSSVRDEWGVALIEYMDKVLRQQVFTKVEQDYFVNIMAGIGEMVYQDQRTNSENRPSDLSQEETPEARNAYETEKAALVSAEKSKLTEPIARARGVDTEDASGFADRLCAAHYCNIALRLTEIQNYTDARTWCDRAMEDFPGALDAYRCTMKLLFVLGDREGLFSVLGKLKGSKIPVDSDTLEMIRFLS